MKKVITRILWKKLSMLRFLSKSIFKDPHSCHLNCDKTQKPQYIFIFKFPINHKNHKVLTGSGVLFEIYPLTFKSASTISNELLLALPFVRLIAYILSYNPFGVSGVSLAIVAGSAISRGRFLEAIVDGVVIDTEVEFNVQGIDAGSWLCGAAGAVFNAVDASLKDLLHFVVELFRI